MWFALMDSLFAVTLLSPRSPLLPVQVPVLGFNVAVSRASWLNQPPPMQWDG